MFQMPIVRQSRELTLCGACELGEKRVSAELFGISDPACAGPFAFSHSEKGLSVPFHDEGPTGLLGERGTVSPVGK
jgi:hypothetical protein